MVDTPATIVIRSEDAEDVVAVRLVNESAFKRRDEADLIDRLRREDAIVLSLIAEMSSRSWATFCSAGCGSILPRDPSPQ